MEIGIENRDVNFYHSVCSKELNTVICTPPFFKFVVILIPLGLKSFNSRLTTRLHGDLNDWRRHPQRYKKVTQIKGFFVFFGVTFL